MLLRVKRDATDNTIMVTTKHKLIVSIRQKIQIKAKWIPAVIICFIFGAAVLLMTRTYWDINNIFFKLSPDDVTIQPDQNSNVQRHPPVNIIIRVMRDKAGNIVPTGQTGGKYTDEYTCDDFATQPEAQIFFDKAGTVKSDVEKLDTNKDGVPCQDLPDGR
jgi:hypothetical protein